nr:methyltransferase domain-containing protein [uncultured Methanospirillum sp.]
MSVINNLENLPIHPAETTDWAEVWTMQINRYIASHGEMECLDFWKTPEQARGLWQFAQTYSALYKPIHEHVKINPGTKVLDVGGGPGSLAIPFAEKGAVVTVVEPSDGMVTVLMENCSNHNLKTVTPVMKRWELVEESDLSGPYDLVIASMSLGMPDIRSAVDKMCSLSKGTVCLLWFLDTTPWEKILLDLWPMVHGQKYHRAPKGDVLLHVIMQMGILPNVRFYEEDFTAKYPNLDAFVNDYTRRLFVSEPGEIEKIREYCQSHSLIEGGQCVFPVHYKTILLWWNVNEV